MGQIEEGIERVESVIGEMEGTVATLARLAMDESFRKVVAGDLMSEVLVEDEENLLLITSLNSEQVLNTANIVDAACVLLVNGKIPQAPMVKMAQNFGISLLSTSLPMFEACKSIDN